MIPDVKLKISLQERSLRGKAILAKYSPIFYAADLQEVERLKKDSKVEHSSKKNS